MNFNSKIDEIIHDFAIGDQCVECESMTIKAIQDLFIKLVEEQPNLEKVVQFGFDDRVLIEDSGLINKQALINSIKGEK